MVIQITARAEERHRPKVSSMARLARVARVDRPLDRPKFLQAGSSPIAHQVEKFLDRCSQRWQKHTADAQKEETELTEQIETARTALANAVRSFEDSKTELGDQVVDVEAHAAMMEDSEKKDKDTVGAALHESIATMKSQLEMLQASAAAMVTEEATSKKRPRLHESFGGTPAGLPAPSAAATQAFPNRDQSFPLPVKQ